MAMIPISNKRVGNTFEQTFCELLAAHGFWAHNMTQDSFGQPADVICSKNGKTFLIDCKVCRNGYFRVSRIEENQKYAMQMFQDTGNNEGLFAILFGRIIYMVPISELLKQETPNIPADWFVDNAEEFGTWVERE